MSRNFGGPKLPKTLLDQVGGGGKGKTRELSRKDRRKAERSQKKARHCHQIEPRRSNRIDSLKHKGEPDSEHERLPTTKPVANKSTQVDKPLKSILKPTKRPERIPEAGDEEDVEDDLAGGDEDGEQDSNGSFTVSRAAAKAGLDDEDAEILALERKLGVKGKKKNLDIGDDELEWLVTGSDSEDDGARGTKRKRPEDAKWLRDKRLKASVVENELASGAPDEDDELEAGEDGSEEDEDLENPFSEDELSDGDFDGLDEDDDAPAPAQAKQRENPYVAPAAVSEVPASGKYIPPSLRKAAASDEEARKQLKRQVQGQLNRLSEANMLSIMQAVEQIYEKNARQHVTSTLVDLLVGLVSDPSALNDTFIILHAAFTAALYKIIGTDFGAQLLERIVDTFDVYRTSAGKQSLNLMAFLSSLYTFQVVASTIIFDYIKIILADLSESNTELLLRLIRTCGTQLRGEDPTSLKDIVLLLQRSVAVIGEANLSVRTKFMIETINNLKNNRLKSNAAGASAVAAENTTKLKKTLGTLNTRARASEPLRITLKDLKESDKKGKWWLVGASWNDPAKVGASINDNHEGSRKQSGHVADDDGYESETPGKPNLVRLARQQGMNTEIRRAIFITLLSALDFKDAHTRLLKLNLKSKQQLEIPKVLIHCAGAETRYNPYYTLVAKKLLDTGEGGAKLKKAFQFALVEVIRQISEADEEGDEDEGVERAEWGMQKIVNLGKFYGTLVADSGLPVTALKTVEWGFVAPKLKAFVDVCLTTVLLKAKGSVEDMFSAVESAPGMIKGLSWHIKSEISSGELGADEKEVRKIRDRAGMALKTLTELEASIAEIGMDDEEGMDTSGDSE
ncbi:MA3 domain [Teratosphaeria destructans]|uniref:MA3 domain n=1 Tax=Teratosphaeria destructans TaxID=418781 RepID=A0A9W7SNY4_9PEZI|nr:MA3 domain [Teratosphaeria destructans]